MTSLLTEIDHVAIAVNDLDAAIAWYAEVFGADVVHREVVESDGVDEALVRVADSYVQLLTPTRDDSPVAKYLAKRGEGLHHVAYRVEDCAVALDAVQGVGRAGHRRRTAPRLARDDGRVRAPQGVVRHADRARARGRARAGYSRVQFVTRGNENSYFAVTQGRRAERVACVGVTLHRAVRVASLAHMEHSMAERLNELDARKARSPRRRREKSHRAPPRAGSR